MGEQLIASETNYLAALGQDDNALLPTTFILENVTHQPPDRTTVVTGGGVTSRGADSTGPSAIALPLGSAPRLSSWGLPWFILWDKR